MAPEPQVKSRITPRVHKAARAVNHRGLPTKRAGCEYASGDSSSFLADTSDRPEPHLLTNPQAVVSRSCGIQTTGGEGALSRAAPAPWQNSRPCRTRRTWRLPPRAPEPRSSSARPRRGPRGAAPGGGVHGPEAEEGVGVVLY